MFNKTTLPITFLRMATVLVLLLGLGQAMAQGCSQPSNLNSAVLASGTVSLSWSAQGGATNYIVQYRVGNSGPWIGGGNVTTTNQVLTGLLPQTVYTWRVRANCSTFSSVATFNSGGGVGGNTACSQPSNQEVVVTSTTTATFSWSAVEGALFYQVQYRPNNLGAWLNAGSVTGLSISVANLLPNTEYGWRVRASCSVYSSVALFSTANLGGGGNTSCSQPSNLDAVNLTTTSAELTWSGVQEAADYTVQYRQGLAGAWIVLPATTATSLVLNNLLPGTEYSWQVKASCSDFASQAVFTTTSTPGGGGGTGGGGATSCSAPSNTNTLAVTTTTANVEWEANPDALNYTVQYRLELGSSYTTVGTFTTASATITGLQANRQYVWRVKANCSPYGSDNQFSTPAAMMNNGGAAVAARSTFGSSQMRLFPNPVNSDVVTIESATTGALITVFNTTGQMVFSGQLNNTQETINVSDFNTGLYVVRLQHADGTTETNKLMIAR
jgi:Secretion system C-terminal sorting domain/Fibronectin type III domain